MFALCEIRKGCHLALFGTESVTLDVVLFVIGRNGIENIGEEYPEI